MFSDLDQHFPPLSDHFWPRRSVLNTGTANANRRVWFGKAGVPPANANVNKGENLATAPKTHSLAHLKNPERRFWEESRPAPLRERKSIGQEGQLQRAVRQEHTVCPPGHYDYHIDRSVSQSQNHKHYQRHRPRNLLHDLKQGLWQYVIIGINLQQDSNPPLSPTSNPSGWLEKVSSGYYPGTRLQHSSPLVLFSPASTEVSMQAPLAYSSWLAN